MAKSGNPATRAAQAKATSSIADIKNKKYAILELPSGITLKVRNPGGMSAFMTNGTIPNSLMGIIQKSVTQGTTPAPEEILPEGGVDAQFITELSTMLNNILVMCAVEPPVQPVPEDEADRDDELLYADEFPEEDKMFIFQWVSGGTKDLESFRGQYQANVDAMGAVAETGLSTK